VFGSSLTIDLEVAFNKVDDSGDIKHNVFLHGGVTIDGFLSGLGPSSISHNFVTGSTSSGITVTSDAPPAIPSGPVTLAHNVAVANQGHGIDLEPAGSGQTPQIIDGGHNIAFANGTNPQCVGITCQP
jgi:hypothetical protein